MTTIIFAVSLDKPVRRAAWRDVAGADTAYDELRERFPGISGDPRRGEPATADSLKPHGVKLH
jgi:hypothetical protein